MITSGNTLACLERLDLETAPTEGADDKARKPRPLLTCTVHVCVAPLLLSIVYGQNTATGIKDGASNYSAGKLSAAAREEPQQLLPAASESESAASSAISGLVAGAAVSTSKQLLLYPVDTVKVCVWMMPWCCSSL